jgi:transcriptional regulator with XRE-family HTH domain
MNLKDLRNQKKMSLAQLAHKLDISIGYLSHIESGTRRMTTHLARKLATIYAVSEDFILQTAEHSTLGSAMRKNWMSKIRIGRISAVKAFKYHLSAHPEIVVHNEEDAKNIFIDFVSDNIRYSLIYEFAEHDELADHLFNQLKRN